MGYEQYKAAYDRDGYVVVKNFLTPTALAELHSHLDRYISDIVPTLPDAAAFYQDKSRPETLKQMQHMGQYDPFFANFTDKHPEWKQLAESLLGEEVICEFPEWFNKPPLTEHPTPAHQDNYYFNLTPPNVLTIWCALDVVDDENGCLRYIPGSHEEGVRPHGRSKILGFSQGITDFDDDDVAREVPIHLQPGDCTIHHGWMIHRAVANSSATRHRRSFALVFKGVSCQRDEAGFARYSESAKSQQTEMGLKT